MPRITRSPNQIFQMLQEIDNDQRLIRFFQWISDNISGEVDAQTFMEQFTLASNYITDIKILTVLKPILQLGEHFKITAMRYIWHNLLKNRSRTKEAIDLSVQVLKNIVPIIHVFVQDVNFITQVILIMVDQGGLSQEERNAIQESLHRYIGGGS